jgi:hypothetical protein
MNAKELLQTYLSSIQNAEAAAALFADDGVIELPTVNARAQGPVAIQRFLSSSRSTEKSSCCTKRSTPLSRRARSAPMESDARHNQKTTDQRFSSGAIQTRTYSGQLRRTTRSTVSQSRK